MNELKIFVVGLLEENCYLVFDKKTSNAALIDPGDGAESILLFIKENNLKLNSIILTHGHYDHIGAVDAVRDATHAKIIIHREDANALSSASYNFGGVVLHSKPDTLLEDGDSVTIGSTQYKVIYTPGHSRGGICLYGEARLFSGDTLFCEGIGRSDLPGGDGNVLIENINKKLFILPDGTRVYPGHGRDTTIGWEKQHNPFN